MHEGVSTSTTSLNSTASTATNGLISFRYVWTVRPTMRQLSQTEAIVLQVSPKFATVHDHVSFQWNLRLHGTTGKLNSEDENEDNEDKDETDEVVDYVAVELYFADGPVSQVELRAVVGIVGINSEAKGSEEQNYIVEERKSLSMRRGSGCELTDTDRAAVSDYIKTNVGKLIRLSVHIRMAQSLFDPFTYLDSISPTPQESFLTTNYNARVNSKVWKKRSRKKSAITRERRENKENAGVDYEARFREIVERERSLNEEQLRLMSMANRRSSTAEILENTQKLLNGHTDHEHLFKKLLISCCESCEKRRASMTTTDGEDDDEDGDDDEGDSFECSERGKEHIHDLLANMYFNKVVLPEMEYVEDFVDFLIECELNDLPVLKRACERYLCSELNTKKDLLTSLLLDMLFISIVFNLNVMKSMTLSELSCRTDDLAHPEKLLEQEEYKSLDKRIRSLSDRNLIELIEQCQAFREQRSRVTTILPPS